MREWQVGDPIGDGNDIGVPDKTGFTFIECGGGYGSQLDEDFFNFIFNDTKKCFKHHTSFLIAY